LTNQTSDVVIYGVTALRWPTQVDKAINKMN